MRLEDELVLKRRGLERHPIRAQPMSQLLVGEISSALKEVVEVEVRPHRSHHVGDYIALLRITRWFAPFVSDKLRQHLMRPEDECGRPLCVGPSSCVKPKQRIMHLTFPRIEARCKVSRRKEFIDMDWARWREPSEQHGRRRRRGRNSAGRPDARRHRLIP